MSESTTRLRIGAAPAPAPAPKYVDERGEYDEFEAEAMVERRRNRRPGQHGGWNVGLATIVTCGVYNNRRCCEGILPRNTAYLLIDSMHVLIITHGNYVRR